VTSARGIRSSGWPGWPTAGTAIARSAGQPGIPLPKRQTLVADGYSGSVTRRERYAVRSRKNRTAIMIGRMKA
jgi:hypothetical protein